MQYKRKRREAKQRVHSGNRQPFVCRVVFNVDAFWSLSFYRGSHALQMIPRMLIRPQKHWIVERCLHFHSFALVFGMTLLRFSLLFTFARSGLHCGSLQRSSTDESPVLLSMNRLGGIVRLQLLISFLTRRLAWLVRPSDLNLEEQALLWWICLCRSTEDDLSDSCLTQRSCVDTRVWIQHHAYDCFSAEERAAYLMPFDCYPACNRFPFCLLPPSLLAGPEWQLHLIHIEKSNGKISADGRQNRQMCSQTIFCSST
jgi:hypothetical protein